MLPLSAFRRFYEDEPVERVIQALIQSLVHRPAPRGAESGRRGVLVYSRGEAFLGCVHVNDIFRLVAAPCEGACARGKSGVLAARSRHLGNVTIGEILGEQRFVEIGSPLVEVVQVIALDALLCVPVLSEGEPVGILTDKDVLSELWRLVSCGSPRRRTGATISGPAAFAHRQDHRARRCPQPLAV